MVATRKHYVLGLATLASVTAGSAQIDAQTVDMGPWSTCATDAAGALWCWGSNSAGLGTPGTLVPGSPQKDITTPRRISLPGRTAEVAVGYSFHCALTDRGQVFCWGQVFGGGYKTVPLHAVPLPRPATTVAVGSYDACALLDDHTTECWGHDDNHCKLGCTGAKWLDATGQTRLRDLKATDISGSSSRYCLIEHPGSSAVWCFSTSHTASDRAFTRLSVPPTDAPSDPLTQVEVFAGGSSNGGTCALTKSGDAYCWGKGIRSTASSMNIQLSQSGILKIMSGVARLVPGGGIGTDGRLWHWYQNGFMKPQEAWSPAAQQFPGPVRAAAFADGGGSGGSLFHGCAVGGTDRVWCWGTNRAGQLGIGRTSEDPEPAQQVSCFGGNCAAQAAATQLQIEQAGRQREAADEREKARQRAHDNSPSGRREAAEAAAASTAKEACMARYHSCSSQCEGLSDQREAWTSPRDKCKSECLSIKFDCEKH